MDRSDYLALRKPYEPADVRLVIVAESPPVSGLYFYNPDGRTSEPLFAAMMKRLGVSCAMKDEGLRSFQGRGWVLVDATYEPINRDDLSSAERDKIITRDHPLLRADLLRLSPDRTAPLILVKANVCRVLEPMLCDEFRVLNRGTSISFPSSGRQNEFHRQFAAVLAELGC